MYKWTHAIQTCVIQGSNVIQNLNLQAQILLGKKCPVSN